MSNYQQTSVSGESWLRAKRIVIENPINQPKKVRFIEEKVFNVNDRTLSESNDILEVIINSEEDLDETLEVFDPQTGMFTGKIITYGEFYAIMFSAYMKKALERDSTVDYLDDSTVDYLDDSTVDDPENEDSN